VALEKQERKLLQKLQNAWEKEKSVKREKELKSARMS
jgi:hypothetical protein